MKNVSDIMNSLKIHSNVLNFSAVDNNLELVFGPQIAADNVNPSKLKGHNLSARTMRNSLPSFLLQIYANPCLYWLHQPAFCVLLQRLGTSQENLHTELERMKQIFGFEFVTRKNASDQNSNRIISIMNSINAVENEELSNVLLTSITPFVFCYLHVVEVIREQVRSDFFLTL